MKLLVGLLEGAVLSPALFAFACSGLLRALRASGLGVRLGQVHVPALMLMDDVILLARSRGELRAMAAVVFEWCWKNRFVLNHGKSHVLAPPVRSAAHPLPRVAARGLRSRPPIVAEVGGLEPSVPLMLLLVGESLGR